MQSPVILPTTGWLEPPYFQTMLQVTRSISIQDARTLIFEAEVLEHFSCSGCGECCQRPWWIAVSKDYLDKWQPILADHPSGIYQQAFTLRSQPDLNQYAEINRKPGTHECVFLMDDRRCFLQATYGEEALSETCRQFPRYESWLGAYLGKFAQTACPDIAELIDTYPRFRYQLVQFQADVWLKSIEKIHPLGFKEGFLWLGLLLDLFQTSPWSPAGKLRYLTEILKKIEQLGVSQVTPTHLEQFYQQMQSDFFTYIQPSEPQPAAREQALDWLIHFSQIFPGFQNYLKEIKSGWKSFPELDSSEQELLNHFCNAYLIYHAVTLPYHQPTGEPFFFSPFFLLTLNLSLIQCLAFYYRDRAQESLSLHHLVRASNLIGYRFEHSRNFIEKSGCAQMPSEAAIQGIQTLLSLEINP